MDSISLVIISSAVLAFGMFSRRLQDTVITPPMVFTLFGFLTGPFVLNIISLDLDTHLIHVLAEITLVLVLFTDASRMDIRMLARDHDLPARLLLIGLPLTIILGTVVGLVVFTGFTLWQAAALASVLAPTDAALGQVVVNSPRVPVRIRQALNVESGLNDGVTLPVVLLFLTLAGMEGHPQEWMYWARFWSLQLILGPLVGVLCGHLAGKLVDLAAGKNWMSPTFQRLSALALAVLAYSLTESVGGNGFIAAFCAGLALGAKRHIVCQRLHDFAEAEGQLLSLLMFMVFGAVMAPPSLNFVDWRVVVYAVLSLTVVRMLPVYLSLIGKRLNGGTIVFLGWFGPRGIASILFTLLLLESASLPGRQTILAAVMLTVIFSILLHGLTASPAAGRYGRRVDNLHQEASERKPVSEMRVRIRSDHTSNQKP